MNKQCTKCHKFKDEKKDFYFNASVKNPYRYNICKRCMYLLYNKDRGKKMQEALRLEVLKKLGDKCAWCGFDDWRALQIDHVNGGGSRIRRKGQSWSTFYKEIIKGTHRHEVQLLCANCNMIKRHKDNECTLG